MVAPGLPRYESNIHPLCSRCLSALAVRLLHGRLVPAERFPLICEARQQGSTVQTEAPQEPDLERVSYGSPIFLDRLPVPSDNPVVACRQEEQYQHDPEKYHHRVPVRAGPTRCRRSSIITMVQIHLQPRRLVFRTCFITVPHCGAFEKIHAASDLRGTILARHRTPCGSTPDQSPGQAKADAIIGRGSQPPRDLPVGYVLTLPAEPGYS